MLNILAKKKNKKNLFIGIDFILCLFKKENINDIG